MNCKFTNVLIFAAGAAIGSAVTWKIVKNKYEKIVQEELASIKEAFSESNDGYTFDVGIDADAEQMTMDDLDCSREEEEEDDEEWTEVDMAEYGRIASNYTSEEGGVEKVVSEPYVISPYDFGEIDGYSKIDLTHYADGTLEDEDGNIIPESQIDSLIGPKALNTYGEYEDDAVFVRNDKLRTDYEILKDYRTYAEARSIGPRRVDNE